jgi:glucoamylase
MSLSKTIERDRLTIPEKPRRAPGKPGEKARWSSGAKTAVGTGVSLENHLWFTLGQGTINEIYFPDVDLASTRSIRFLVTDENGMYCDEELIEHLVEAVEDGVPAYVTTTSSKETRFSLKKEITIDGKHDVLLVRVTFQPQDPAQRLFLRVDPQIEDQGQGNCAHIGEYKGISMLFGHRDRGALAAAASVPYLGSSCGYVGRSDSIEDLKQHGRLITSYNEAPEGNVALTAEIDWKQGEGCFVLAVGFGENCAAAAQVVRAGLLQDFEVVQRRYVAGWKKRQAEHLALEDLGGNGLDMYRVSVAVLESHQSKRYPGSVASLSIPWGFARGDADVIGYHVVWPRDLVEQAFGKLACGDVDGAKSSLFYLAATQEADGHWSQNFWLDGTPHWKAVQMDSTALPLLLACRLWQAGELGEFDEWPTLRKATEYLLRNGPCSEQDRWEEVPGYAVFTMAAEVAAVLSVAGVAIAKGKHEEAELLHEIADAWNEAIDEYTYVTDTTLSRKYDVAGYYIRIAPPAARWRPLKSLSLKLVNNAFGNRRHLAVDIVSPDALMLVRMGLRRPDDPRIVNTVKVLDGELKQEMATGPGWIRSSFDGYGEKAGGAPFEKHGIGRCWPLLAGERGHYAVAADDREMALKMLRTMARQTSSCGMLPEQVWNAEDIPERELFNGKPTGSGMPLAWAHAEYVKLLRSLQEGFVWDMPSATRSRYLEQGTRSAITIWTPKENRTWICTGKKLQVMMECAGVVRWAGPDQARGEIALQRRALGFFTAVLPTENFSAGSRVEFEIKPEDDELQFSKVTVRVR